LLTVHFSALAKSARTNLMLVSTCASINYSSITHIAQSHVFELLTVN
jgi:hypothetical protein